MEKVGSGEVCFNSSFLSYSVVIPPHKKNKKMLILTLTRLISGLSFTYCCIHFAIPRSQNRTSMQKKGIYLSRIYFKSHRRV